MTSAAFARQAVVTASTKRSPGVTGGKRGAPAVNLNNVRCTPLDPVQPEINFRQGLQNPFELLETFVDAGLDIVEGDILVVSSKEYAIKAAAEWTWRQSVYLRLILEENK
jgi:hypothetical protein